eukprot:scaffold57965_cov14-Tisochrysis_lutea.AAC.1
MPSHNRVIMLHKAEESDLSPVLGCSAVWQIILDYMSGAEGGCKLSHWAGGKMPGSGPAPSEHYTRD